MAEVSKNLILELQKIVKDDYSKKMSFAETSEIANNLVGYFDLLRKLKLESENKNINIVSDRVG